jgi:hypothetical protein
MLVNSESVMIKKSNLQAMNEKLLNWSEQIKALAVSHQTLKREFESEFFKLNNAVTQFNPRKPEVVFALTSGQLKDLALTSVGISTGLCYCIEDISLEEINNTVEQFRNESDLLKQS